MGTAESNAEDLHPCGGCGRQVTSWPYAVVSDPDGASIYYHEGCEPWRHPGVPLGAEEVGAIPDAWRPAIAHLVDRLVAKDYAGLSRDGFDTSSSDPDDASLGMWIEDYPATLVGLPDEAWGEAERGRWVNDPSAWWVVVPLWTAEEGRSDLSLEPTVWEQDDSLAVSIDQVHVM